MAYPYDLPPSPGSGSYSSGQTMNQQPQYGQPVPPSGYVPTSSLPSAADKAAQTQKTNDYLLSQNFNSAKGAKTYKYSGDINQSLSNTPPANLPPSPTPTPGAAPTPAPTGGPIDFTAIFNNQNTIGDQDRENYTAAQWNNWKFQEEKRLAAGTSANQAGNCPPNKPFTSRPGPDGRTECAFKPDDCPEGTTAQGHDNNLQCLPVDNGGGAGGRGGQGGQGYNLESLLGGGSGGLSGQVESALSRLLSGEDSRYSNTAMQGMLAGVKQQSEAAGQTAADQSREDFASRGMYRSGASAAGETAARTAATAPMTQAYSQLLQKKADADYQDKVTGLNSSMEWLNQIRQAALQSDMTAVQREQLAAQTELAYANIQSEFDQLKARAAYGFTT